jgi:hypothetical protein
LNSDIRAFRSDSETPFLVSRLNRARSEVAWLSFRQSGKIRRFPLKADMEIRHRLLTRPRREPSIVRNRLAAGEMLRRHALLAFNFAIIRSTAI